MINKNYIYILTTYFTLMLLPLFITNKYTISLSPILILFFTLYFLKDEIRLTDYNSILTNKLNLEYSYQAFVIAIILQALPNWLLSPEPNTAMVAMFQLPIISVYAVFFGPILEEIVFRKIIYGEFQKNFSKFSWVAAIQSSLLFAMFHFDTKSFIGYFAVGMVFSYFYHKSKSIYVTVLAHTYLNFLVILVSSIKHT